MDNDQHNLRTIRATYPGTSDWLTKNDVFKKWLDPKFPALPTLLWLNGQAGAGKTVLASRVVDEAQRLKPSPAVLYFYCKHSNAERDNFISIARTLLAQLLQHDDDLLGYLYESCCQSGESYLTSHHLINELLKFALDNCPSAYIVLDGIDECERAERKALVTWFRDYVENQPSQNRYGYGPDRVHCLFISRVNDARKDFSGLASVTVDTEKNEADIEEFSRTELVKLRAKFNTITDDLAEAIVSSIGELAAGMFLFVKMSWVNLHSQHSLEDLEKELRSFPTHLGTLEQIYNRILDAINSKPSERDGIMQLLSWVTFAKRPLKLRELQALRSISKESRDINIQRRSLQIDIKDFCRSLIEVTEDQTVNFVHLTVKRHLQNFFQDHLVEQELSLAMICMSYLTFDCFDSPLSRVHTLNGDFGFLDYSVIHWLRHLEAGLKFAVQEHTEVLEECAETLGVFIERCWNNPSVRFKVAKRTQEIFEILPASSNKPKILQAVASTRKQLGYFGDLRQSECVLKLARLVNTVRGEIENAIAVESTPEVIKSMEKLYGNRIYKCPRLSCRYFTDGFETEHERKKHSDRHERPFRCKDDDQCPGYQIGFPTEAALAKHMTSAHPNRNLVFATEEEVAESIRAITLEQNPETEPEPALANLLKQAVVEVPEPESESEPDAAPFIQSRRGVRETKRLKIRKEYSCDHCGKKFTKKWNWQSHLATHEGGEQLSCEICGKTCARMSDLVRHIRVQHSASKSFSCGGCGKSFTRNDILQTHFRSKKGQQCLKTIPNAGQVVDDV